MKRRIFSVCIIVLFAVWISIYVSTYELYSWKEDSGTNSEHPDTDRKLINLKNGMHKLEDIKADETILAVKYENWAWGHQNYLLVINKRGRCKFLNLEDEKPGEENMLFFMDACLADDGIPYLKKTLELGNDLLETIINTQDFDMEKTGEAWDAGCLCYYSVYGCGEQRKLVCMQTDGDIERRSCFREVKEICEKMYELYREKGTCITK